jgi:hypothetical protein
VAYTAIRTIWGKIVAYKVEPPVERPKFWPCLPKRTRVPPPPATANGAARKAALMAFYWTLNSRFERTLDRKSREPRTVHGYIGWDWKK